MIEPITLHSRSRPKRRKIEFTMIVSTSWLIHVEPLLRSHRCLPPVTRHQKWYSRTSMSWATRYAVIDAITRTPGAEKVAS